MEQTLPDYHILSNKLYILPFLFWVQFLRQLIGIFHFSWFSPGSRLYEMVYTNANDVEQPPFSVSDCRLVLLIRLALYQYGYITDVPLNRMFAGQAPSLPNRKLIYALDMRPTGFPYRRYGTEKHARGGGDMDQK